MSHLSASACRRALMEVAQGLRPADLVVRGARVLNVFTAEVLPKHDVAVHAGRIAYVGPDASHTLGDATRVIDADGQTLLPGFVEGHTHLFSQRYGIEEFIRHAAPGGTTTVITEISEFGSILGVEGLRRAVDGLRDQPIRLYATLPPLASLAPHLESVAPSLAEYRELLARPEVVGLGELFWGNLLRDEGRLLALVQATLDAGKVAEGHTAGARGAKLQAYACAGISSCHEPIDAEQGLERLRLGMHFMARHGEIRQDLPAIAPIWRRGTDLRRMILVTDGISPRTLLENGYLETVVQEAIELGLDPARAIQMATLNPAEHFKLDHEVGSIAPGRGADLLLVPDERMIKPSLVVCRGREIARDGRLLVEPRPLEFPPRFYSTIKRPRIIRPSDFAVPGGGRTTARVRVIELVTDLVSREGEAELRAVDGRIEPRPDDDLVKVVAVDRGRRTGDLFVGFVRGYGLRRGAVATSMAWDSQSMVAVGADDRDLALALCRLLDSHGGAVACLDGKLLAEFVAPLGGLMSEDPLDVVVGALQRVEDAARELGCRVPRPILALDVLTTAAIPFFRITDHGYVRVRDGEMVGLFAD